MLQITWHQQYILFARDKIHRKLFELNLYGKAKHKNVKSIHYATHIKLKPRAKKEQH